MKQSITDQISANIHHLNGVVKTYEEEMQRCKEHVETLKQDIIVKIRSIVESTGIIDPKTTDFEITSNQEGPGKENYFTVDFTYYEGETYDPFIHPHFTLYSIDTKGSRYIDDTTVTLYVTYKYNPPQLTKEK